MNNIKEIMMRVVYLSFLVLVTNLLIFSVTTFALPIGYQTAGSGTNVTITSDTGLQWLSPTATDGMSYNQILSDISTNGSSSIFHGYRRATEVDLMLLFSDYGLTTLEWTWVDNDILDIEHTELEDFMTDFGLTHVQTNYGGIGKELNLVTVEHTMGYYVDSVSGLVKGAGAGTLNIVNIFSNTNVSHRHLVGMSVWTAPQDGQMQGDHFGQWLVSDPQIVPEPTTIALLGIGLAGLASAEVRRRRKREKTT
jgi:hypothetical protein